MPKKLAVPAGTKFGSWTVLAEAEPRRQPSGKIVRMMHCQCKCGCIEDVCLDNLRRKYSKQCFRCGHEKHCASETPEYACWSAMHNRCYNSSATQFARYGARGVHVCERWHRDNPDGFINFLNDMGKKPSAKHSLDKDVIKPGNLCYCPEYCRWATPKEQQRAIRSNQLLQLRGKTQCIAAWTEELGSSRSTIAERLRSGWSVEDALTKPVRAYKRKAA